MQFNDLPASPMSAENGESSHSSQLLSSTGKRRLSAQLVNSKPAVEESPMISKHPRPNEKEGPVKSNPFSKTPLPVKTKLG